MNEELKAAIQQGIDSLRAEQAKVSEGLKAAIEKHEKQVEQNGQAAAEVKGEVKTLAEQFSKLQTDLIELQQKGIKIAGPTSEAKTIGQQFINSEDFKAFVAKDSRNGICRVVDVKNTVDSDTTTTFPYQKPGIVPGSFVPLTVRAALPSVPVSSSSVEYLKEASWVNSAAEASHGSSKNDSAITFSLETCSIRTVAHTIKVTKQLLADAPAVARYIDTRLRHGLAQRVDTQLVNGNGTSPNLSGLTDSGNYTAYTPTSGDNLIDAINRLLYSMWATGNRMDLVLVNPADWGAMERTREGDGSGMYLYGIPGLNAGMNPFGVPVVISNDVASGKIIAVRRSDSVMVYDRESVDVEMGYVNDDFQKNLVTIRAEERLGLAVERPAGVYYGDFTA